MKRLTMTAAWVLSAMSAPAEPRTVLVTTTDDREFSGSVDIESLKVRTSRAVFTFRIGDIAEIRFKPGEPTLVLLDGRQYDGKIQVDAWVIKNALGEVNLQSAGLKSVRVLPVLNARGKPAESIDAAGFRRLGVCVAGRPAFRPGGESLVLLNATDGTLMQVSAKDLTTKSSVKLPEGSLVLALTPKGDLAAVASGKSITLVDLEKAEVVKTFEIEKPIADLVALDGETLVASSDQGILVISAARQSVVRHLHADGGFFLPVPGGGKIYGARHAFALPANSPARAEDFTPAPWSLNSELRPEKYSISPDGRLAVGQDGSVLRTANSHRADLAFVGKISPHLCSAVFPGLKRLIAFTAAGEALVYELPALELKANRKLGRTVSFAIPDERRKAIFGWSLSGESRPTDPSTRVSPLGDLIVLPIPE
ncbi:MAG: hypothetical protein AAB074_08180 [Planctomycetota bacterium]